MLINANFKRLFLGRSISNIGDSFYTIGLSWYIFSITNSASWVGILNFFLFLPNVFSFLLGNYIERHNQQRLLVTIEALQGLLLVGIIATIILPSTTTIKASLICGLAFVISTIGMNAYVIEDTLMPVLVSKDKLSKAAMIMSFSYNSMDYLGNALGGLLLKMMSVVPLLIMDVVTFILSALHFSRLKFKQPVSETTTEASPLAGMSLIFKRPDLLTITLLGGVANFMFGGLTVYDVVIGNGLGGSAWYGFLLAIESVGVTLGSTFFAQLLLKKINLGKLFCLRNFGMALFLIGTIWITNRVMFLSIWLVAFMFQGLNRVVMTPYLQATIADGQRAKFFSAFNTLTVTPLPLGALLFGKLSTLLNWQVFIAIFSGLTFLSALGFLANTRISHFREADTIVDD